MLNVKERATIFDVSNHVWLIKEIEEMLEFFFFFLKKLVRKTKNIKL